VKYKPCSNFTSFFCSRIQHGNSTLHLVVISLLTPMWQFLSFYLSFMTFPCLCDLDSGTIPDSLENVPQFGFFQYFIKIWKIKRLYIFAKNNKHQRNGVSVSLDPLTGFVIPYALCLINFDLLVYMVSPLSTYCFSCS
jgi:hypothetical protein